MKPISHIANIRNRLKKAFNESELTDFCFDYFPPVYDRFARVLGLSLRSIRFLIG